MQLIQSIFPSFWLTILPRQHSLCHQAVSDFPCHTDAWKSQQNMMLNGPCMSCQYDSYTWSAFLNKGMWGYNMHVFLWDGIGLWSNQKIRNKRTKWGKKVIQLKENVFITVKYSNLGKIMSPICMHWISISSAFLNKSIRASRKLIMFNQV